MDDVRCADYNMLSFARLAPATETLRAALADGKGARIGQTTVISRKVHLYDPQEPETVQILRNSDAGQTFYGRDDTDNVYHIDVFHQCGIVDPKLVAQAIMEAVSFYNEHYRLETTLASCIDNNYIDIQTAGGGGRITGILSYGKKASLCRAHENHVHSAIMLPLEHMTGLFYIVQGVEHAILASGLELRCNERIVFVNNDNSAKAESSDYSTDTDSLLQDNRQNDVAPPAKQPQEKGLELGNNSDHDNQMLVGFDTNDVIGLQKNEPLAKPNKEYKKNLQHSTTEVEEYLQLINKMDLKRLKFSAPNKHASKRTNGKMGKRSGELLDQGAIKELAVIETIYAAVRRMAAKKTETFQVDGSDLRSYVRRKSNKKEICLIMDASASMEGARINTAKNLAYQLLSRTPDRISVITFQGNRADIKVPLTRNLQHLEQGLNDIVTEGLTPLALGLKAGLQYLKQEQARRPLIVLITDGIPNNVSGNVQQCINDAMEVAGDINKAGYKFVAIGLKSHQRYLTQLSEVAGGTVYVFKEFDTSLLQEIVLNSRKTEQ